MTYIAFFDGSAQPNPGEKRIGGQILDENGNKAYTFSMSTGYGTNNEAEYEALLEVVKYISKENIKGVKISGDSLLVVNQVNGKWKCKKPELLKYRDLAMTHLKNVTFELTHVPRAQNMEADMLSRKGN